MKDSDQFLKDLGAIIKKLRHEKGLTSVELGYKCNMDKPNINRLENGKTNPTFLTLIRICIALEVELKDLFSDFELPEKLNE